MSRVSFHTDERIEAVPGGLRRTLLVVIEVDGISFTTEATSSSDATRITNVIAKALSPVLGAGGIES